MLASKLDSEGSCEQNSQHENFKSNGAESWSDSRKMSESTMAELCMIVELCMIASKRRGALSVRLYSYNSVHPPRMLPLVKHNSLHDMT